MPELNIWERERNTAMKVFSRLYVGLKDERTSTPLGFATPYEENAAGRKRQETVDRWSSGYGEYVNGKHVPGVPKTSIMDNLPREGFMITDDVKRVYWGGGNVVWRVYDPAGFELEIQSQNLMAIIQSCGINEGGLIPGRCIWGRSGGDNILLHETSEEYKDSVKAAETLKAPKQVSASARRVGGLYRRVNGTPAIFVGKVHVTRITYPDSDDRQAAYLELPEGKCLVGRTEYNLSPSEPFEAMLEVEDDGKGGVKLTNNLTLYKKAPCVDDLGDVKIPDVTTGWLLKLNWSFASSSIHCKRIVSVTTNPILNPTPWLMPWARERFNGVMSKIESYIKNNSRGGAYPYRMPLDQLFSYREEDVMLIGEKLYGAIGTVGNQYVERTSTQKMYDIAIETTLTPGTVVWTNPSENLTRMFDQGRFIVDRNRVEHDAMKIGHVVLPRFNSVAEFYAYCNSLFTNAQLFYITAKESNA